MIGFKEWCVEDPFGGFLVIGTIISSLFVLFVTFMVVVSI